MKKNHKLPLSMVLSGGVLLLILLAALLAPLSPHDPVSYTHLTLPTNREV